MSSAKGRPFRPGLGVLMYDIVGPSSSVVRSAEEEDFGDLAIVDVSTIYAF